MSTKSSKKQRKLSSHSWEYGTTAHALLELYNPELSVFSKAPFPNDKLPEVDSDYVQALTYAKQHIAMDGDALIPNDTSTADPTSLGIPALLLGPSYHSATARQIATLLRARRFPDGALSHRVDCTELWADFIAMAPPYLAYYAVHALDEALLREAVAQCGKYREVLGGDGLWRHIAGPREDCGMWSTGNGWAAMGMARVLAVVKRWGRSKGWADEQRRLEEWVREILDGVLQAGLEGGLVRNYVDDEAWFGETSGTALLAARL